MYINGIAHYVPEKVLGNDHFVRTCGLTDEWIQERTGIRERRMAPEGENTNTMGVQAVNRLVEALNEKNPGFDLIIGATYTPYDTVVTLAHYVQHHMGIADIPTISVSTACSSLLNAIEIAEGYFAMNKATRALIVASEHNTAYFDDHDRISGPLWGDGAVALSISREKLSDDDMTVLHLLTGGAATVGKATESVYLRPWKDIFSMPNGRDVFLNACEYMTDVSRKTLDKFNLSIDDIAYFVPHQANKRISTYVAKELNLPEDRLVSNIERYGNTGCCGFGIGMSETKSRFKKGDKILVTVFGGGYSFGTMLVQA